MSVAATLAERAAALRFEDLPADAVHWASMSIVDTYGVMLAGLTESELLPLRQVAGDAGTLGRLDLAMILGCAAHVLDFDISGDTLNGHPTVQLLPAALVAARDRQISGRDFLTAYAAGFEVQSAIARGINPLHVKKGWFPSGTIGVFGAAVAAARIMGLDAAQIETAINLAANFAAGSMSQAGTLGKPLAAGQAARSGVLAAGLAARGVLAAPKALEDRRGYLMLFNGPEAYDTEAMLEPWGEPFDIETLATGIKRYPCCGVFHSSLDILIDLAIEHDLAPDEVVAINAALTSTRLGHIDRRDPRTATDAKFSAQYCFARAVLDRRIDLETFEHADLDDAALRSLMQRVTLATDPQMPATIKRAEEGGASIRVTLRDGTVLERRARYRAGREPGHPLSDAQIRAKFLACAERALDREDAEATADDLFGLAQLGDVDHLVTLAADCVV